MPDLYVSIYTHEFALAFCQATAPLCPDVQRLIWKEVLYNPVPRDPPPTPTKCRYSVLPGLSLGIPRHLTVKKRFEF